MKRFFGVIFMLCGAALLAAALSLFLRNEQEAQAAEQASVELMPQLVAQIQEQREQNEVDSNETTVILPDTPIEFLDPSDFEMTEVEIDGYGYIGYLSIPSLNLELPVMGDWDYPRLRIAPCRYTGSVLGEDMVIMAHNYARHFGGLRDLQEGAAVIFVDMDGNTHQYEVVAKDILAPTAVEEMTSGDFDLTLFTCTYGGASRVTVYCDKVDD